jgi:toxin ParE1/3/4
MPRYRVILLAEARDELRQIALIHKAKVGPKAAKRITDRILAALYRLEDFPTMGTLPPYERIVRAGYRMLIVDDYLCFYTIRGTVVHVVHIVHGSVDYIRRLGLV